MTQFPWDPILNVCMFNCIKCFLFKCIYFVILYARMLPPAHTWSVVGGTGKSHARAHTHTRAPREAGHVRAARDHPMRLWPLRKDVGHQSLSFSWCSWSGRLNAPVRGSWFVKFEKCKRRSERNIKVMFRSQTLRFECSVPEEHACWTLNSGPSPGGQQKCTQQHFYWFINNSQYQNFASLLETSSLSESEYLFLFRWGYDNT